MKKILLIGTATLLSACNGNLKRIPPGSTAYTLATIAIITIVLIFFSLYVYRHLKKN